MDTDAWPSSYGGLAHALRSDSFVRRDDFPPAPVEIPLSPVAAILKT
jgi:hypothetical protein